MIVSRSQSQPGQRLILSILIVSGLCSKLLHIYQHRSLPLYTIALYFPTFFTQEVLLFVAVWLLLHKTSGWAKTVALVPSTCLACLDLVATASQFSFYYTTGGEIRWTAARALGASEHGLKLILSGLAPTVSLTTAILLISWFASSRLHRFMFRWLAPLFDSWLPDSAQGEVLPGAAVATPSPDRSRLWTLTGTFFTLALLIVRPAIPYNHMTASLPFIMMGGRSVVHKGGDQFPLPALLEEANWEPSRGHYKGWEPDSGLSATDQHANNLPAWAREPLPPGFDRWATNDNNNDNNNTTKHDRFRYDPIRDPMRVTNMQNELLAPLKAAIDNHGIPIHHIVFIFLESGRKDLFPLKKDSRLYEQILETNRVKGAGGKEDLTDLHGKLSRLTPIAEFLTGEASGFNTSDQEQAKPATQSGGINIDGIVSGSTLSAKARIVDYCGARPLPVDFMHENDIMPYQPCLMHIMELFNRRKAALSNLENPDPLEKQWKTIYAQSVTGRFQNQVRLMEELGFNQSIYGEEIKKEDAKYWHEGMEKINYFGYPETEVLPYMRDAINQTLSENKRLFLSHFTSSTHHPWATAEDFPREQYFGRQGRLSRNRDMDHYLNACHFVDTWLGDIMSLLDEAGIANETMTVFVGDHGQAFKQDSDITGTYQNPHISNFRVPLLFHHPLLPRIQVTANASTISILPTILDLLVNTGSLNPADSEIALDLMNEYEGQSLIRPYQASQNGREAWNFGVINTGGTLLSISSAAVPFRLVFPLAADFEYYFTHLGFDPHETSPITDWTMDELASNVGLEYGPEAFDWVIKAEQVGNWWVRRQKLLWDYKDLEE